MLCVIAVVDSADAWQHPARADLTVKHKAATTVTNFSDISFLEVLQSFLTVTYLKPE
jgi:hypothetical protein